VLLSGEIGYESDTHKVKIGDGVTAWNNLKYVIDGEIDLDLYATKEELNEQINYINFDLDGDYIKYNLSPGLLLNGKTFIFNTNAVLPYKGAEEKIV
jgi:hypothetical protein